MVINNKVIIFLIVKTIIGLCFSFEIYENKSRYDHHRIYHIHLDTEEQLDIFKALEENTDSCMFLGHPREIGQKLGILVAGHKIGDFTDLLERFNVTHAIPLYNFQDLIDEEWKTVQPKNTSGMELNWTNYFYLETIYDWMDGLQIKYPQYIKVLSLGESHNGIPIKGVRLSKNPGNTGIFIEGGIHAREWISPAVTTFILNELLTANHSSDIHQLSEQFDWYFFPITNPDGYRYTFERDRMWRKSRKPYGLCVGADLNRNFDAHWNSSMEGSGTNPCAYDFAGSNVNSEIESVLISKFLLDPSNSLNIKTYLSLHSFSQLIMFPFGYGPERVPNYDDLMAISVKAAESIEKLYGRVYRTGSIYNTIYPASGGSKDWAYSKANISITFTFELRGPANSTNMFVLPASEIIDNGRETLAAFCTILQEARKLGYYN